MLEHSSEAKRLYNSKAWRDCRESYIKSVHGLCERCERPGSICHHKEYITIDNIDDPYVTLSHDNLEFLCIVCHNHEHFGKRETLRAGFTFDDEGNLIEG